MSAVFSDIVNQYDSNGFSLTLFFKSRENHSNPTDYRLNNLN